MITDFIKRAEVQLRHAQLYNLRYTNIQGISTTDQRDAEVLARLRTIVFLGQSMESSSLSENVDEHES